MHKEEVSARSLSGALSDRLASTSPDDFTVELSVFGVHCHCDARSRSRRSVVHCFEHEYYLELSRESERTDGTSVRSEPPFETVARGRTSREGEVLDAVGAWLRGASVHDMYTAFAFVDRERRALEALEALVLERRPALRSVTHELQDDLADISYLWFRSPGRSCRLSYYGKNEHPDARFHWDECQLFEFRVTEPGLLSAVLERWLCGGAPPSAIRREFPWLEIGKLADYYEAGRPIEGEFLQSWDSMESFYRLHGQPNKDVALQFIAALRAAGYDRELRAGQSLWSFIVSRARRHGLEKDQPNIVFNFHGEELVMHIWDGAEELRLPRAELTPEVNAALRRLAHEAID